MIIVMKMTATEKDVEKVSKMVTDKGLNVSVENGTGQSVIGIIGDTTQIDPKARLSPPTLTPATSTIVSSG